MTYQGKNRDRQQREEKADFRQQLSELNKLMRQSNKTDMKPVMTEVLKQFKQTNFYLMCITMILAGIFIRLVFLSLP